MNINDRKLSEHLSGANIITYGIPVTCLVFPIETCFNSVYDFIFVMLNLIIMFLIMSLAYRYIFPRMGGGGESRLPIHYKYVHSETTLITEI